MSGKLTVRIENFREFFSNSLVGFVDVIIAEMHLKIREVSLHESHGKRWCALPAKLQADRSGQVRTDEHGKRLYTPAMSFLDKATADAFSARVIEAVLDPYPDAFDEEGWRRGGAVMRRRPFPDNVRAVVQSLRAGGLDPHVNNGIGNSFSITWEDHSGRHRNLVVSASRSAREASRASIRDLKRLVGLTTMEVADG